MIEMEPGTFYRPTSIYEGYGVYKVLDIRKADESIFAEQKESYYEQLRTRKKYDGFKDWLDRLRKQAAIDAYTEVPMGIFP